MKTKDLFMGIDTSNYKTSLALVDLKGEIVKDLRKFLSVASGQKGLRQSEAIFQHMSNIPILIKELFLNHEGDRLASINVSVKPRPLDSSYMPCFKAGESLAISLASALNIPINQFSHQEGHIAAIREDSGLENTEEFLVFHLSGGTTEVLHVKDTIRILGGTKDISYGQLIDRAGVKIALPFPCGETLDDMASKTDNTSSQLKGISFSDGWINLSGIDTQLSRALEEIYISNPKDIEIQVNILIRELFDKISQSLIKLINFWTTSTGCNNVLMTGGVSSSKKLKSDLREAFDNGSIYLEFGKEELAADNAVGLAFLGRKIACQKTQ